MGSSRFLILAVFIRADRRDPRQDRIFPPGALRRARLSHAGSVASCHPPRRRPLSADLDMPSIPDIRIGQGYDVHAFGDGDHVVVGGVRIPHERGVLAHSDGDVALHALCDAILGALALGDIGVHFPPSDARWKDVDSRHFLRHCNALIGARGWRVGNVDITVVCERPKIGPHAAAMREAIAVDLGIEVDAVSVKATTSERLGFTGRGEGIAAQAVCLLVRGAA